MLELAPLVGNREIDAVLVSIGANDVGFGAIATFCAVWGNCPNQGYNDSQHVLIGDGLIDSYDYFDVPVAIADDTFPVLHAVLDNRVTRLPQDYAALAFHVGRIAPADRVYLTHYPDVTRDENGAFCDPMLDLLAEVREIGSRSLNLNFGQGSTPTGIYSREAAWAYDGAGIGRTGIVTGLNAAVSQLHGTYGWHVVDGIADAWRTHGYCAADPWVVRLKRSLPTQGNQDGTLHPTVAGHAFTGMRIAEELKKAFYDAEGLPRPPASAPSPARAASTRAVPSAVDTLVVELEEVAIDFAARTATLGGTLALSEGVSVACGDDVVLSIGNSTFAGTIDGATFQALGSRCRHESPGPGITSLEFDLAARSWHATLAAVDLSALTNPIDVSLEIGGDTGRDTVIARELAAGWFVDPDVTPPAITLRGPNPQVVSLGEPYHELGATAVDDVDGDRTSAIAIDASAVNVSAPGAYAVAYRVSDAAQNVRIVFRGVDVTSAVPTCNPGNCDDGDPCTADACDASAGCVHPPIEGVTGATCVCQRTAPQVCAGRSIPKALATKASKACTLLGKAAGASKPKKVSKLLKQASKLWKGGLRLVGKSKVRQALTPECASALAGTYGDAIGRATRAVTR